MSEEHGYHRSGKKCREKFENLYKYYKKTKEGKAGRQDGKNYRFFRQLEAIYGESASSSNNQVREAKNYNLHDQDKLCNKSISFSISNSSHDQLETSSSENNEEYDLSAMAFAMSHSMDRLEKDKKKIQRFDDDCQAAERSRRLGWREKLKAFVDLQMRKLVEGQEAWMGNILKTVEQREQERAWREIEWRKQEAARLDREHELWARERAWMEARDAALMEALKKSSLGYEQLINVNLSLSKTQLLSERGHNRVEDNTSESETWNLIQLRTSLDSSFQECGYSNDELWEVIAAKMTCLGHNLSGVECKERWENIRASLSKVADVNRKVA